MSRMAIRLIVVVCLAAPLLLTSCGDDESVFRVKNTDFYAEQEFSIEVAAAGLTSFDIRGINGSVNIKGVSGADQIKVSGVRRVESESGEDAQRNIENLQVEHALTQTGLSVETSQPDKTEGRNYIVNYTVTLPKGLAVEVQNVNGAISVESVQEVISVTNVNGSISVKDIYGSATISQSNGDIDAAITIPEDGFVVISVANGDIVLEIPQSTSATLTATWSIGSISITNLVLTGEVQEGNTLTGVIGKGDGSIVLTTSIGDITVTGAGQEDDSVRYPLASYTVIQNFGNLNASFGNRFHCAEDALGRGGTPVYAIADGVVSYSGPMDGYGWLITVDHSVHDVYSLYGHLSTRRSKISEGYVRKGDIIAYLADDDEDGSGGSYPDWGPHLHFGIRQGSVDDYPPTGDGRWMAGYTVAYPPNIGWLRPSTFILEHSD